MNVGLGLRLSAAAIACAALTPAAFAGGQQTPNNNVNYSAESVALGAGNVVFINGSNFFYSVVSGGNPIQNSVAGGAVTLTFSAPAGDTFANPGAAQCIWQPGAVATAVTATANNLSCPNPPVGGPYTSVQLSNPGAGSPVGAITLTGPDVATLGQNIYPNLTPVGTNPSAKVQITAQLTGTQAPPVADASPLLSTALVSHNSLTLNPLPLTLLVDLTGSGVAAGNMPGGVFAIDNPNGTRGVSKTGSLGSFAITESQFDLDARTALPCIGGPSTGGNVNCASAIAGTVAVTLTGDFATLTNAFLIPNNASGGLLVASQANCTPGQAAVAPANANQITGTIDAAKRNIAFTPPFPTPLESGGAANNVYGICLTTNGTQVIQAAGTINWMVSVALAGGPTVVLTTAPSAGFSSIAYAGSQFFASNVFGFAQTGTRTYFRAVNLSNTPAQIWAVMTNDVTNQSPVSGQGSCTFPAAAVVASTSPDTATCNTSFVANLTSPFVTSNSATSAGLLQPNTATYYVADDIAALAGTTATSNTNGFLESTVRLMSPNTAVVFSALSQGSTGILVNTP